MTIATTTTTTTSSVTADRKVIIPDGVGGAACAAVGAKTARACDYCVRKRARWYCAADDAFLCQLCDGSVHSANPLARRHNRVRLKTASSSTTTTKKKPGDVELSVNIPSWQRGLKRKPRTPRGHRAKQSMWTRAAGGGEKAAAAALWKKRRSLVVPEFGVEDNSASTTSHDEEEEEEDERQLVYRVPVFDPFESELCTSNYSSSAVNNNSNNNDIKSVFTMSGGGGDVESGGGVGVGVFMPSDLDLEEFERLLGKGLDGDHRESQNQSCCLYGIEEEEGEMGGGGLLDHCGDIISNHRNPNTIHHHHNNSNNNARLDCSNYLIKPEEEEEATKFEGGLLVDEDTIEPFELTFDYDDGDYDYPMPPLPTKGEDRCEMELHVKANGSTTTAELEVARGEDGGGSRCQNDNRYLKKMVSLKLQDYDAIANAWHQQTAGTCAGSSPWIDGERPSISPDECNWWPHQHYHHHPFFVPGSEDHPNLPFGHHHQQQQQGIIGPGNVVVVGGVGGGEGREARVSRYREKRRTRLFSKKIRYEVRKLNAEKRPRVKGRFVKRTGSTGTAPPATGAAAPAAAATAKPVRVGRQKVK